MSRSIACVVCGFVLLVMQIPAQAQKPASTSTQTEYKTAEEAYQVGVVHYNARNFKASRAPLESALRLAKDETMRLKVYQALLGAYREIPEFEPFQTAAEYIIGNSPQSAERSLTRRAFLSFAVNRGQVDNLIERYERKLKENKSDYVAVSMLADIYTDASRNPTRSIELLKQLEKLEAKKNPVTGDAQNSDANKVKVAMEKAKLAGQYVQAKEFRKAAKLYEEIAPLDPTTQAWNLRRRPVPISTTKTKKTRRAWPLLQMRRHLKAATISWLISSTATWAISS